MFKYTLLLILIFNSILCSQNYLWPTNASRALSSSFCEYRPGHYHSAIDIKTWNREGYKCFAVEDGIIERIKISPFGAGKSLYIKLNDGRRAVYFHLQKFTKKLEAKISERQRAEKSYSIEWWPKNWRVKKGEIVAYTGQTGIGVPHLHFEIRDEKSRPLNPLQFYDVVLDKTRPILKELLIIPQNEKSSVNGTFRPQKFTLFYEGDGNYKIIEPIHAKGVLGLAISGYDQADGVSNKLGFYSSKLQIEGKQVFHKAYDILNFKNTRMVDIDIYYPEKSRSRKRFYKLYIEPFNELDFYKREVGTGLIKVEDDTLNFEMLIEDYFKNKSIVSGKILPGSTRSVKLNKISVLNKNAYLKMTIPAQLKSLMFLSGKSADSLKEITYYEIIEGALNDSENNIFLKVRLAEKGDFIIQTVIENRFGQTIKTEAILNNNQKIKVETQVKLFGKQLYLSFRNVVDSENLVLNIHQNNVFSQKRLNTVDGISEYVFPGNNYKDGDLSFSFQSLERVYFDTTISPKILLPAVSQKFSFFEDSLLLASTVNTVYDTLFFTVQKESVNKGAHDLPVFGSSYKMSIGDQILSRTIKLSVKSDSSFFPNGQSAIYALDSKGLHYIGGKYNPETGNISTRVKTFATYIIAADTVAPEVKVEVPGRNKSYKSMPGIVFKATDSVSKIGSDKNIEIYFDDEYVVPEWDFERNIVKGKLHYEPSKGAHKINIKVKDRSGNLTEKVVPFVIY